MKKAIAAAFAALALFGCVNPSDKAETSEPLFTAQSILVPSAPQPIAPVTNADTNVCKNAWASDWAKKHGTTVAAAERYARRISTSPPTTLRINGQDYVFNAAAKGATVWSTCEASLKAARGAPAQARVSVQDPATAALIADLRAQNQRLTAENHRLKSLAYQNSEETDPAKLISNQAKVADLERRLDEAARPVTKTMIILATMVGLAGVVLGLFIGSKRWRRRPNRTIGS